MYFRNVGRMFIEVREIFSAFFPPTAVPAHQILAFPEQTITKDWTVAPELVLPESQVSCAVQSLRAAFPRAHDPHALQVLPGMIALMFSLGNWAPVRLLMIPCFFPFCLLTLKQRNMCC